jgi:hypothetical protein
MFELQVKKLSVKKTILASWNLMGDDHIHTPQHSLHWNSVQLPVLLWSSMIHKILLSQLMSKVSWSKLYKYEFFHM